jgi:NTP pyrophosphatase (non-canonical NTP hydrolase)
MLQEEVRELIEAVLAGNVTAIQHEAADVANFAMLLHAIAERGDRDAN